MFANRPPATKRNSVQKISWSRRRNSEKVAHPGTKKVLQVLRRYLELPLRSSAAALQHMICFGTQPQKRLLQKNCGPDSIQQHRPDRPYGTAGLPENSSKLFCRC